MKNFQNKFRISSARAVWHDYNFGAYFITVCTKNKEHFLGEIINNQDTEAVMHLSDIGHCLADYIQTAGMHCSYAEIPLFVVMPNHFHAIIFIDNDDACRDVSCRVSTLRTAR